MSGDKRRRRRIIYNNDGNDIFNNRHATPEDFLAERILPALNTQVDSIFYCTGVTSLYDHDTDVAERSDDFQDVMGFEAQQSINRRANMHMLREAGVDSLSLVTQRVHDAGLEVFWTHRINDIHDSFTEWLFSKWKREHPEYLMGVPEDIQRYEISHPRYMWSTLDFERPEVLYYLYLVTEEVCQKYDIDGIEIDYFRHPLFFRPNLEYMPATPAQVEIMTAFQRRCYEMAQREGERRGRPILVAAHVPLSVEKCMHVGIDIERWLQDGLLDVLITGSGYQPLSMPVKQMVELGHAYDVPVYPIISASGMEQWGGHTVGRPMDTDVSVPALEAWRGAASNIWQSGADGISLFNWFPGQSNDPLFTTLGDPETLSGLEKIFGIDNTREFFGCLEQAVVQDQILPVEIDASGEIRKVNLIVEDDVAGADAAGRLKSVSLHVQYTSLLTVDVIILALNGTLVEPESQISEDGWITYRPEPELYQVGDNVLSFQIKQGGNGNISVRSVVLRIVCS